jgi:uncharacterized membrane protein YgcG
MDTAGRGRTTTTVAEDSEGTALVVGIVAAVLIAIILVVLLVLKFKSRTEVVFGKVIGDDDDSGGLHRGAGTFAPASAPRYDYGAGQQQDASSSSRYGHPQQRHLGEGFYGGGGSSSRGAASNCDEAGLRPGRVKSSKDVKEWYV